MTEGIQRNADLGRHGQPESKQLPERLQDVEHMAEDLPQRLGYLEARFGFNGDFN